MGRDNHRFDTGLQHIEPEGRIARAGDGDMLAPGDHAATRGSPEELVMSRFEHVITVDVPIRTAYNQWTQFESFPAFMDGVEKVTQLDDRQLEWTASVAGQRRTWKAVITDQTPDVRIAWKSTEGADNAGAVLFQPIDQNRTQITLRLDVDPQGIVENIGDAIGAVDRRTKGDLERFKDYIEDRGRATGAWRGEIHGSEVRDDPELRDEAVVGSRAGGDDRR